MKIVIDTNMIIAALIKDSKAREIIISDYFDFVSPDFVLDEIYKYEDYICEKSGLSKDEFELLIALIFQKIKIISSQYYKDYLKESKKIMEEDVKDAPYVACYFALKCTGIWTNDNDYKNKEKIKVLSTKDLLKMMNKS